jgi:hypothetical protein
MPQRAPILPDVPTEDSPPAGVERDLAREPSVRRTSRGHAPKIAAAVGELEAEGELPPHLRPAHRDRRILDRLVRMGYERDLPNRDAIRRFFQGR